MFEGIRQLHQFGLVPGFGLDALPGGLRLQAPDLLTLLDLGGDVDGELGHLHGPPVGIQYWIVAGFDPDLPPILADAAELAGLILAPAERIPEARIVGARAMLRVDEHAVVLPDDLRSRVADGGKEVGVRLEHPPVQIEADHRLRLTDRIDLSAQGVRLHRLGRDVGGVLDDPRDRARPIADGVVRALDPDRLSVLGDALEFGHLRPAGAQPFPERGIVTAVAVGGIDEQAMMAPADLVESITHDREEGGIGRKDCAVRRELDNGLGCLDRSDAAGEILMRHARGCIGPLHDVARELLAFQQRRHNNVERAVAEMHDGLVALTQAGRDQGVARGVAAEAVDVLPEDVIAARGAGPRVQQIGQGRVHRGDDRLCVEAHHRQAEGAERCMIELGPPHSTHEIEHWLPLNDGKILLSLCGDRYRAMHYSEDQPVDDI